MMTTMVFSVALLGLSPDMIVDPDYHPKVGDRAVLAFYFTGITDGPRSFKAALAVQGVY